MTENGSPQRQSLFKRITGRFWKGEEDSVTYKKIIGITWPAFIELLLASMFGMIDLAMVGRLDDPAAISGIGLTGQPVNLLIAVFAAVNVGTTTLVSWGYGAGERKRTSFITKQAILLNCLLGLVSMTLGLLGNAGIINFMMNTETAQDPIQAARAVEHGIVYMRIMCWGLPFQAITMCITAALRGCGQSRIPMVYNVSANLANVVMNYIMIYGKFGFPAMGVAGAALSTSISRALACAAAVLVVVFWKDSPVHLRIKESWRPCFKTMKEMVTIGLPAAGEQFVIQTGLMMYQKIITTLGVDSHAAHQVAASINGMVWSIAQAFAVCTSALVGQSIGAEDTDAATRYCLFARRLARLSTAVVSVLFVVFARPLVSVFTPSESVIEIAIPVLFVLAVTEFIQSNLMSTTGALRGAGDTMYPLYASIIGIWGFRLALAWVFVNVFHWGLVGAWCSYLIDQFVRDLFIQRRFRSGKWRFMRKKPRLAAAADDDIDIDAGAI